MTKNNRQKGYIGEKIAENYLLEKGYEIILKNYYTPFGEIDIIAESSEFILFVEVKYSRGKKYGYPSMAVTEKKKERIYQSAEVFIGNYDVKKSCRFDVIEIFHYNDSFGINHIENAFW